MKAPRQQSCDEHNPRVAGCMECRRRARNYQKRRDWALNHGVPTSGPADLCCQWVRELRAAGYTLPYLEEMTGLREKQLWEISNGGMKFVQLRTYHGIEKAYRELRWFPGPSSRAATFARKNGWTPPDPLPMPTDTGEAAAPDIDWVVVQRLMDGEPVKASKHERYEAARVMHSKGGTWPEIQERLKISGSTLSRILADQRIGA